MANYGNQGGYGQSSNPYAQQSGNPYAQQSGNPYGQQSGNPYGQQASNPYAQQQGNPYSQQQQRPQQQSNPYSQPQRNPYGQAPGYGRPNNQSYNSNPGMANGGAEGESIPMGQVGGAGGPGRRQGGDSYAILNDCQDIDRGIDAVVRNIDQIKYLQQRSLDDPDGSRDTKNNREMRALNDDTQALTSSLKDRIQKIKSRPEAGETSNSAQVTRVNGKLQRAIQEKQKADADFRRKLQEQNERQYRIVRPDASEAEVREACADPAGMQVFSQALLQSDRRGQSQSALRAVQGRHEAIQKIEQDFIELARLYEELNQQVVVQEAQVVQINEGAERVQEHITQANTQLDGAVEKARARNRKKWWCVGIIVAIIAVIVIIILILGPGLHVIGGNGGK